MNGKERLEALKLAMYNDFLGGKNYNQLSLKYGKNNKTCKKYVEEIANNPLHSQKSQEIQEKVVEVVTELVIDGYKQLQEITQNVGIVFTKKLQKVIANPDSDQYSLSEITYAFSKLHETMIKTEELQIKRKEYSFKERHVLVEEAKLELLKNGEIKQIDNSVGNFINRLEANLIEIKVDQNE